MGYTAEQLAMARALAAYLHATEGQSSHGKALCGNTTEPTLNPGSWRHVSCPQCLDAIKLRVPPRGRMCEYCRKPGGPSHSIQVGGQMRSFFVHRQCYRKLV